MKKFVLFFVLLILSSTTVVAQYKRKLKEPDFFIPYNDRMHKPEILPKLIKTENTINKTAEKKQTDEIVFDEKPEYKKIYDEYLIEINNFLLTKKFEENKILDNDLSMMNGDVFEVDEDVLSDIKTQEQYNFYMLAKKILDN